MKDEQPEQTKPTKTTKTTKRTKRARIKAQLPPFGSYIGHMKPSREKALQAPDENSKKEQYRKPASAEQPSSLLGLPKMKGLKPVLPPVWKRYTKEAFKDIVAANCGIVTLCAGILDCTYTQFYDALRHWGLQTFLDEQKRNLVARAEAVVLDKLSAKSDFVALKAAELTLRSQAARQMGWGEPTVQVAQQIVVDRDTQIRTLFNLPTQT